MDSSSPKIASKEKAKKIVKRTYIRSLKSSSEKSQMTLSTYLFKLNFTKIFWSERRVHKTIHDPKKCIFF